ncbi:MAG: hypothetical protein KIT86_00645 [Hydrogenophaga sp.]|uniref:hypothetical protein n=1 Tax=Hydrogenophaga sp. TaxID=1904254 RepID=UPI002621B2C6|nr:hypothetical protein [Hydrogenophaga sp.]MCW5668134.1 hypothetical protein [Hydrogenophaga sp.]
MNSLLEFAKTPEGQGLLSAAFGGLAGARRGQPLNSIGRGGLAGLAGYANAQDREMQAAENAKQNEIRTLQVDTYKQSLSAAQRKAAEEARQRELVASQFAPVAGTSANAATGVTGPRPEAATAIGQTPKPNYQLLLANGVSPELVKALAEAQNLGRAKVARTVKGMGPDGREMEFQVDDYGERIGEGLAQYRAPIQADTGGAVQFLDPYTQKPVSTLPKSMSPDAKASNALGWANNAVSRERLNLDRNGYTFNDSLGGYVPKAPGGAFVPLNGAPGGGTTKLTEGEAKGTLYLGQMRSATNELNKLTSEGKDAWPSSVAMAKKDWANWAAPANAQQVSQLQDQWSEAFLRAKTGAAATPGEVTLNNRTFFPQVGDGPDVIAQKARMRAQAEQDMGAPAGRGVSRIPEAVPVKKKGSDLKGVTPEIAAILNKY